MMVGNLFSKTPMWAGWNTQWYPESTRKHVVCYMQNIKPPPTRKDVLKETLKISQAVAKECGNKCPIVIWLRSCENCKTNSDLKLSRIWWLIYTVWSNPHNFIIIFISTKILEGSGAAYILSEAKITGGSSINKFLAGKPYSCCCSGNPVLATAMHSLHLDRFIEDMNIPSTNLL